MIGAIGGFPAAWEPIQREGSCAVSEPSSRIQHLLGMAAKHGVLIYVDQGEVRVMGGVPEFMTAFGGAIRELNTELGYWLEAGCAGCETTGVPLAPFAPLGKGLFCGGCMRSAPGLGDPVPYEGGGVFDPCGRKDESAG